MVYNVLLEKDLLTRTISLCTLFATPAFAEVIFDQIGPNEGSQIGAAISTNQYFESDLEQYNIAVIEYLPLFSETTLTKAEVVIDGWDGFKHPSSITEYQFNIYSTIEEAGTSLIGDVYSLTLDTADITISADWLGPGYLVQMPIDIAVLEGAYWCSLIPSNVFDPHGQIGVSESLNGDGIHSMQANPGEGFGFGPTRTLGYDSAFRLSDNTIIDPCDALLPFCPEDITLDGYVTISDLLEIIANWGSCGDGTYRPVGDCAPLPNGDCCINIADILAVVAAWNNECTPHGACCLPEGICQDDMNESSCTAKAGVYLGNGGICADAICEPRACCVDIETCLDVSSYWCIEIGGLVQPEFTCAVIDCSVIAAGDECDEAIEVTTGSALFDTTFMSPSLPLPNEALCPDSNLEWNNSKDVWYSFSPPSSGFYAFSLCDSDSFDTSMVLYEGNCSTQVACNGDAEDQDLENCQEYYSEIEYFVTPGTTYYIRIGGWYGQSGQGTLSIFELPPAMPGACCFANGSCADEVSFEECDAFGGTFMGSESLCIKAECIIIEGDECDEAGIVTIGQNLFSTVYATPSEPEPSESMCQDSYFEWENSPDIWLRWLSPDSGTAFFTTCDTLSFDTSMVLYEGDCSSQVACNGDAVASTSCQNYHSEIEYQVAANTYYYIRIGGWQGTVGDGTLTIELEGDNDTGACCVNGSCLADELQDDCLALSGDWRFGETCKEANCANIPCHSSTFTQSPDYPDDAWYASNSSSDAGFDRAEFVGVDYISKVTVWGFQAYFDGTQWSSCDSTMEFTLRSYADAGGVPGEQTYEQVNTVSTAVATGTLYAGLYELIKFEMSYNDINVEHLSVQAETDGLDCWFLWMSSSEGDATSSSSTGSNWTYENVDLSICID